MKILPQGYRNRLIKWGEPHLQLDSKSNLASVDGTNEFLRFFLALIKILPHVHTWDISESDRHWLTSLEYLLKYFSESEKNELCMIDCRPALQRSFTNLLYFQETTWNDNLVVEVLWNLNDYIGHLCVEDPFNNYVTVIHLNPRLSVMNK
jgi:hypothetical protein